MGKTLVLMLAAFALAGGLMALFADGPRDAQQEVRARSFVLVDGEGRERGRWTAEAGPDRQPALEMVDAKGRPRVSVTVIEGGAVGAVTITRASHVEPIGVEWIADLAPVGGPAMGPFRTRAAALGAEVRWLGNFLSGEKA